MDSAHRLTARHLIFLAVVSLTFLIGAGAQGWRDAATFDEPVYLSSGVGALLQHDVAVNSEHPPIFKALAALPVLLAHPVPPDQHLSSDEHSYSAGFLQAQEQAGKWVTIVRLGRIIPILEALVCAWLILAIGGLLSSASAGTLAAALWLTAPLVLGLGHLDGVDLPFALTTLLTCWALLRWWEQQTIKRTLVVGAAVGLTAAAQISGILLLAVAMIIVARMSRSWRRAAGLGALVCLTSWLVLWASYLVIALDTALHGQWLLPRPYLSGLHYLLTTDAIGTQGYLLGRLWTGGQWWFWPVSLLIKTAVTTTALIVLGLIGWRGAHKSGSERIAWVIGLSIVALSLPLVFDPRDIGVRYLLPQFGLLTVVAGGVALLLGRVARAAAVALAVGSLLLGWSSNPHSLAWATFPFEPAYRNVSNSSVDWGQDLGLLQRWAVGRHPFVSYFGPRGTGLGDIPGASDLAMTAPQDITGWVAVSATNLTSNMAGQLAWLRKYCPSSVLGGTILIYHFESPPNAAPGPSRPPAPCD